MIKVNKSEQFPIVVSLIDETTGMPGIGQDVYYEIRTADDQFLSPNIAGMLQESTVEAGIYRTTVSISDSGEYIIYATCSGFVTNAEDLIVNKESIYDLAKQNRNYNISVEDVPRTNSTPTASQILRKVPLGRTDYIINKIKGDSDVDWSTTTTSGVSFAWYMNETDKLPYKMGDGS